MIDGIDREWLESNGLGGFASSTVPGINTRRYHGLLTVATKPPVGRMVLLSKLEDTLVANGHRHELSANCYPGAVHPRGFEYLKRFSVDPFPRFTYDTGDVQIDKAVFMVHGENATVIQYKVRGYSPCTLELRPLIAFRDYHSLTHANDAINTDVVVTPEHVVVTPYRGLPALYISHTGGSVERSGTWYYNFEYASERQRGLEYQEDLFNPCVLRFEVLPGDTVSVIASTSEQSAAHADSLGVLELRRRAALVAKCPVDNTMVRRLFRAADHYVVSRGELNTIIAGYHWFSDWGRDTMIALPGIALVTGRPEMARGILLAFANHLDRGMLPNRFPDAGEAPEYNTVDATLGFFEAVRAYIEYTGDIEFAVREFYPRLKEVIDWHLAGTRYGICVDRDGLLKSGVPGAQLTWMDAKIGDWVVTPRHGKPVEIEALWYNALRIQQMLAHEAGDSPRELFLFELANLARESFGRKFWNGSAGCLYDVIDGDTRDASIRPNQIFAVSLHHPLLQGDRARRVVEVVERELLTPLGLRSLARTDPAYRPHYEGDVPGRDSAYHQGTVWPWLAGPFTTAYMKAHGRSDAARERVRALLAGFAEHLDTAGLGHISEIADAEPPYTPRGCIAQAWSVAEVLRAAIEDVYEISPASRMAGAATGE